MLLDLGLGGEPVATQVVARDRHAQLVAAMAVAASSLDRLATELRHLQRTELREAEEAFGAGQKGSSAMPHKRNPITAERISGLARVVRGHAVAALEDVALWHERDISHSSVERVILPDAFLALDYMLARARTLLEGLVVHPERMRAVLESSHGLVYSQRVLLGLVERGLTREEAYALVQRNAMRAWDEGRPLARRCWRTTPDVTAVIARDELRALLDPSWYTRHVPALMERVAGPVSAQPPDSPAPRGQGARGARGGRRAPPDRRQRPHLGLRLDHAHARSRARGAILTALSALWFARTADIVPNHLIERSRRARHAGAAAARCCRWSAWPAATWPARAGATTSAAGEVCGHRLPEGLRQADRLPEPIFTPATKATEGHDENITRERGGRDGGRRDAGRGSSG